MNSKSIAGALIGLVIVAAVGLLVVNSGDDSSETSSTSESTSQTSSAQPAALPYGFNVSNLAPLEQGVYEGWVVRGDDKFSFGTFNTTSTGSIVGQINFNETQPVEGDKIVVTIEPSNDTDPGPSSTVVLAGDITNGKADLTFPVDLSTFSGRYITGTPTNDPEGFENSGIWFVIPGSPLTPSLNIPDAPDGWIYEGWVVYEGTPYSTGKFKTNSERDDFNSFSGINSSGPNYPGEDFVRNLPGDSEPFNLDNGSSMVVVSLEPDQDGTDPTGDGPAQVKPLSALISASIVDHTPTDLTLDTSAPSGSLSL